MGTILANFQAAGNLPVVRDKLNFFVTLGTTKWAVALSILADASASVAFLILREEMRFSTSSLVQRNSLGNLASGK